jgi:hypothetical protein
MDFEFLYYYLISWHSHLVGPFVWSESICMLSVCSASAFSKLKETNEMCALLRYNAASSGK